MTIILKETAAPYEKRVVDLDGPDGNAYFLMGLARRICKEMDADPVPVIADMTNGDYEHLIDTFDRYFGEYVDLYRSPPSTPR